MSRHNQSDRYLLRTYLYDLAAAIWTNCEIAWQAHGGFVGYHLIVKSSKNQRTTVRMQNLTIHVTHWVTFYFKIYGIGNNCHTIYCYGTTSVRQSRSFPIGKLEVNFEVNRRSWKKTNEKLTEIDLLVEL